MPTQSIAGRFLHVTAAPGKHRGFTLMELMIVVAIVGLLTAIAFPSYQRSVGRGQRTAAQGYATDIAQREEQYFLDNHQYTTSLATLNFAVMPAEVAAYYGPATITNPTVTSYVIAVAPLAGSYNANHPSAAHPDGIIYVNNLQQQYRSNGATGTFNAATDCNFSDSTCNPQ